MSEGQLHQKPMPPKNYSLEIVTPIYIGSSKKLNKNDFYYDRNNKTVLYFSENKLKEYFVRYHYDGSIPINAFLRANRIKYNDICKEKILLHGEGGRNFNEINLFIRNAFGEVYIPGSSLKGAIRTALIYYFIYDDKEIKEKMKSEFYKEKKSRGKTKITDNFIFELLPDKYTNILNSLMVSDSLNSHPSKVITIQQKVDYYVKQGEKDFHSLPTYSEFIKPKTIFNFNISYKGISSQELENALRCFVEYQSSLLEKLNRNVHMPINANINVGGRGGFFTKSLLYEIIGIDEATNYIKEFLDLTFTKRENFKRIPIHKHMTYDRVISPRTIKYTESPRELIGYCRLKEVDCF